MIQNKAKTKIKKKKKKINSYAILTFYFNIKKKFTNPSYFFVFIYLPKTSYFLNIWKIYSL